MDNIRKIFLIIKSIKFDYKLYFSLFLILTFLVSIFEILGLSLIFPLLDFLLKGETSQIYLKIQSIDIVDLSSYKKDSFIQLILLGIVSVYLLKFFIYLVWIYFINRFSALIQNKLASKLIQNYINEDYSTFTKKNKGEFIRNVNSEVSHTVSVMLMGLNLLNELVLIVFILGLFLYIKTTLMIYILIFLLLLFLLHNKLTKNSLSKLGLKRSFYQSEMINKLNQIFNAIKEIKLSSLERKYVKDFSYNFSKLNQKVLKISFLNSLPRPIIEIIFVILFCITIFVLTINQTNNQQLDYIPNLAVLALGIIRILPSLSKSLMLKQNISANSKAVSIVFEDIQKQVKTLLEDEKKYFPFKEEIELRNISFNYKNSENKILKNINLKIRKNECFGIFGKSGIGKTTLVDLVSGLLEPTSGEILVDGSTIDDRSLRSWQNKISNVSQNFYIFNDTIKNNVTFFDNENFDQNKFDKALKISQLEKLKNISDDLVGESGSLLSGGQNQRIAIARAIYLDKEIIIFDEPSSMLDDETKKLFLKEIKDLKKYKTIIIISHDKETLEICDKKYEII